MACQPNNKVEQPATGNARSAATIADELSEPSDGPAGRRLDAACKSMLADKHSLSAIALSFLLHEHVNVSNAGCVAIQVILV
jgi:hypothetical protein